MEFKTPLYLLFGKRPVRSEINKATGDLEIYTWHSQGKTFKLAMNYLKRMYTRRDDEEDNITELTKQEFDEYIEKLKQA